MFRFQGLRLSVWSVHAGDAPGAQSVAGCPGILPSHGLGWSRYSKGILETCDQPPQRGTFMKKSGFIIVLFLALSGGSVHSKDPPVARGRTLDREPSELDQIALFHCFDLYHRSPDSGERQYKSITRKRRFDRTRWAGGGVHSKDPPGARPSAVGWGLDALLNGRGWVGARGRFRPEPDFIRTLV